MPTYVYKFIDTGETVEVQQSFTDDTLTEYPHPKSGATMAVKKVFLPVGVTFKGDGFYKTDSRSGAKKKSAASSSDSGSSSSGSSDSSGSSGSSGSSDSAKPKEPASTSSTSTSTSSSSSSD